MTDDELDQYAGKVHRHDAWVITRVIVLIAFVVALVVLAFDNRDEVRIGYVFGSVDARFHFDPNWIFVVVLR